MTNAIRSRIFFFEYGECKDRKWVTVQNSLSRGSMNMPKSRDILKMMNSGAVKRMGENHDKETKRYEKENDLCNDSSRSHNSKSDRMRRKES